MAHACTHRVYLRKGRANTRLVQVIDSPYLPEEKIRIAVTEAGICDEDGSTNMMYNGNKDYEEEFSLEPNAGEDEE